MESLPSDFPPLSPSSLLGPPPPKLSYADNLMGSKPAAFPVSFHSPPQKLSFSKEDLSEGAALWSLSLVGYSIGQRPYYERLLSAMKRIWALKAAFKVTHLPGFLQQSALPFHLETGYIEVDEVYGVELFYYFIESERNPSEDPLLLWLTGGPGCSAFSGLSLEIGPLKFISERYNGSLPNLVYHPYSWTKISNIIFLDSPVGTGFSFSNHPQGYETGDKSWSKHAIIFLRKWLTDHQQFLSNPLYIAGDSYAGKVVPLVVHNLLNENDLEEHPKFNIQGYMIGNPITGELIDYNARVPFAFGMGIISDELYQGIDKNCKGEDYVNPTKSTCAPLLQIFEEFKSELMTSQILEPKCSFAAPKPKSIAGTRRSMQVQESNSILFGPPIPEVKCRTYAYYLMYIWANSNIVQEALNVKKGTVKEWQRCNDDLNYTMDISSSLKYQVNITTNGYRALVYSGDHDMVVPFVGTMEWIKSLKFSITDRWRSWHVGGQVAGYTESYSNNMTFATVKGAGHTAPEYKAKECLAMFRRWISHRLL